MKVAKQTSHSVQRGWISHTSQGAWRSARGTVSLTACWLASCTATIGLHCSKMSTAPAAGRRRYQQQRTHCAGSTSIKFSRSRAPCKRDPGQRCSHRPEDMGTPANWQCDDTLMHWGLMWGLKCDYAEEWTGVWESGQCLSSCRPGEVIVIVHPCSSDE